MSWKIDVTDSHHSFTITPEDVERHAQHIRPVSLPIFCAGTPYGTREGKGLSLRLLLEEKRSILDPSAKGAVIRAKDRHWAHVALSDLLSPAVDAHLIIADGSLRLVFINDAQKKGWKNVKDPVRIEITPEAGYGHAHGNERHPTAHSHTHNHSHSPTHSHG